MRSLATKLTLFVCCLLVSGVGTVFADANPISALQEEVRQLNTKLNVVEGRLATMGGPSSTYVAPAGESSGGGLLHLAQDVQMGGYVEVQYNQNLTKGGGAIAGGNTGRVFDTDTESFTVNAAKLWFGKEANPEGGAGFRIDLVFGEDGGVVAADGVATNDVDMQQAYVEYVQPLSFWEDSSILPDSVKITAGRFATLAGFEVIEGPDNWNISRSFAFGMGIPFIHTGVRTNFGLFDDYFDVYVGVNNGWDLPVDNNKDKTLELAFGWEPLENVSLFHAFYWGDEYADTGGYGAAQGHRFLNTNTLKWEATDKLTLATEINVGNERRGNSAFTGTGTANGENVTWHSYNWYARYQATEKTAVTYRGELFRDQESFRTGLGRTLWEQTVTLEHQVTDNLIARAEYRLDHCNGDDMGTACYTGGDASQQTIGGQVIYLIG